MYCLVQVFTNNSSDTNAYTMTDFKSAIHHIVLKGRGCFTSRGALSRFTCHCKSVEVKRYKYLIFQPVSSPRQIVLAVWPFRFWLTSIAMFKVSLQTSSVLSLYSSEVV